MAVPVEGSGEGTFSLSSNSGCIQGFNCQIQDTAEGEDTRLVWGLGAAGASTLTAVDTEIDTSTDNLGVAIGRLTWTNTPIFSLFGPSSFDAVWNLQVNFTEPVGSQDSEQFALHIVNTPNPSSDEISGLTLTDLSGLSWDLGEVAVSGLQYNVPGGSLIATGTPENQAYLWTNKEGGTSTLTVTANFTSPSAVPEPTTLVLLGTGLVGVAAGAWRKRRQAS
jgi:hypothetical protein